MGRGDRAANPLQAASDRNRGVRHSDGEAGQVRHGHELSPPHIRHLRRHPLRPGEPERGQELPHSRDDHLHDERRLRLRAGEAARPTNEQVAAVRRFEQLQVLLQGLQPRIQRPGGNDAALQGDAPPKLHATMIFLPMSTICH